MRAFFDLNKNTENLHHAYFFITQNSSDNIEELKQFLESKLNIEILGNPDFYHRQFESFGIDNARFIGDNENRKSLSGGSKVFIIETDFINHEAQNALLKIFEEPSKDTYFFIFSPQDILIPTLKSRMQVFLLDDQDKEKLDILKMPVKKRLDLVKDITDGIKDEEMSKQDAIEFLNKIEESLYKGAVEKFRRELELCQNTRLSLYDKGAPIKIILENLVISV